MKKLFVALFAAASLVASAQTKSGSWAIEFPKDAKSINVAQTFTPFFKIENEERVIDMRLNERDMNNAKHWLSIDVVFLTNKPKNNSWPKWLDDVQVEINIFLPVADAKGNISWAVIGGKQTLASLQADGNRHFVRMMVPPEVIYRYFVFDGATGELQKDYSKITADLRKIATELPIGVTITYGGRPVSAVQTCGRDIFSRLEKTQSNARSKLVYTLLKPADGDATAPTEATTGKLFSYITQNKFNPQTFKYMPDELLPVSKTPFAWVLFDRFEPIKENAGK